jgi:hypothetical protein
MLLTEGMRSLFFERSTGASAPRVADEHDYGAAEPFIPQKEKVLSQLKTLRGLRTLLIKLADVRNWGKLRLRGYFY